MVSVTKKVAALKVKVLNEVSFYLDDLLKDKSAPRKKMKRLLAICSHFSPLARRTISHRAALLTA